MNITWTTDCPNIQSSPMHAKIGESIVKFSFAPWRRRASLILPDRTLGLSRRGRRFVLADEVGESVAEAIRDRTGFDIQTPGRSFKLVWRGWNLMTLFDPDELAVFEGSDRLGTIYVERAMGASARVRSSLGADIELPLEVHGLFATLPLLYCHDFRAMLVAGFVIFETWVVFFQ